MSAKHLLIAVGCCWLAACSGQDQARTPDLLAKSRAAAHPGKRLTANEAHRSGALAGAESAKAVAAYDDTCTQTTDAAGNTLISCDYEGVTCVETYDADGNLSSWDCGEYGSYVCAAGDELIVCTYTDYTGSTCEDTYDRDWILVDSTCAGVGPSEECTETEDGGMACTYDDGFWACEYVYGPAYEILSLSCTATDGSREECEGDAEVLSCEYSFPGTLYCAERYAVANGYGILESSCDWDLDGRPDCARHDDGILACVTSEPELYTCTVGYDEAGSFVFMHCDYEGGGETVCERGDEVITCVDSFEGSSCTTTYDLSFNFLTSDCYVPEPVSECVGYSDADSCAAAGCEWQECAEGFECNEGGFCAEPIECVDTPNVHYVGTAEQCPAIDYVCGDGQVMFSNACGCGCIDLPCEQLDEATCGTRNDCQASYAGVCDCECDEHQPGGGCDNCPASCFVFACEPAPVVMVE